jgi:hypothetical protein
LPCIAYIGRGRGKRGWKHARTASTNRARFELDEKRSELHAAYDVVYVTKRPGSESDTAAEELRRTMHYDDG